MERIEKIGIRLMVIGVSIFFLLTPCSCGSVRRTEKKVRVEAGDREIVVDEDSVEVNVVGVDSVGKIEREEDLLLLRTEEGGRCEELVREKVTEKIGKDGSVEKVTEIEVRNVGEWSETSGYKVWRMKELKEFEFFMVKLDSIAGTNRVLMGDRWIRKDIAEMEKRRESEDGGVRKWWRVGKRVLVTFILGCLFCLAIIVYSKYKKRRK